MSTPEGRTKARLKRRLLALFPGLYWFMPVQSGLGASTLDFLVCIQGLFVAIETKARNGCPTPLQQQVILTIRAAGGYATCINDENLENELDKLVKFFGEVRSGEVR